MSKLKVNLALLDIRKQEKIILAVFALSLLLYITFILFGDIQKITSAALKFNWKLIPLLLILTLFNYFFRAVRFYTYLHETNIKVSFVQAIYIFMSGLSMTVTPGKSGEIIKAYFIKKTLGNRFSEVIPILITERLTDGIAMILLALGGIFFVQNSALFLLFAGFFSLAFILFILFEKYLMSFVFWLEKRFPKFKLLEFFSVFFHNAQKLLTFKSLTTGIGLGMIAWAFEAYSLYILVREFVPIEQVKGIALSFFIFSFSSIAGFFVLIPGGIGVAEGSISYFLSQFFSTTVAQSIFITLLFRFITLWFGVSLGLCFLVWYMRKYIKSSQ